MKRRRIRLNILSWFQCMYVPSMYYVVCCVFQASQRFEYRWLSQDWQQHNVWALVLSTTELTASEYQLHHTTVVFNLFRFLFWYKDLWRRYIVRNVVRTSSTGRYVICTSSAHHLQNSSWSAWTWTIFLLWQELVIEWNLSQQCWVVSFQDHVNNLRHNLCWWFSLHVTSGHCSHVICICTCHPHIICIICSGPWYISS